MVAVALFGLAMALAYGGLDALLRAQRQLAAESARLAQLQFAIGLLERDVRSAVMRPVRDAYGAPKAALRLTRHAFELTRGGYGNGLAARRAELERAAWSFDNQQLRRLSWPVLDAVPGTQPRVQPLLEGVLDFSVEALASDQRWHAEWPPLRATAEAMPLALRLRLRTETFGEIERLLELPDASAVVTR
jgi:general secretion pathway protein J